MAKYCTNCGKKLEDGKECTCVKEKNHSVSFDLKESIDQTVVLVKDLFVKPTDAVKHYVSNDNLVLSIILLVLGGIITGLFGMVLVKELVGIALGMMFGGSSSLFGSSIHSEIPYLQVFFITTISVIIVYLIQAAITFVVGNKCFKIEMNYKNMVHLFAALSIFNTFALLISIIGIYISIYIVYGLLLASSIMTLAVLILSLKKVWKMQESHLMYTVLATILLTVFLVLLIVPKLFV